ncbi:ribonucleoside triphosphate reductase, partial [Methanophagales archaeon]
NLDLNELRRKSGGLFGYNDETGSIGVVTINLSQLGYLSHSESEFFERLDEILVIAKEVLECKRKIIQKTFDRGLLPYTKQYLKGFDNHFSTIGVIAGEEMCQNLLGCSIATETGREFAIQVLKYIRERIREFQEETGNLYNLEATPAEGASYRLARIDRKKFGRKIFVSGTKTRPFYVNSTQLPYDHNLDLISVLEHQEPLQTLYSGGTILHCYLGEQLPKEECKYIVPNFVEWLCTNWRIPYYTLTPTYSVCRACGKTHSGAVQRCPDCSQPCEIYSRVVGYYSPIQAWNPGKREEFKRRTVYTSLEDAMNP